MNTDELRAKFEAFHGISWDETRSMPISSGARLHLQNAYKRDLEVWQAAYSSRHAEVEVLRKDAERYRWLRENGDQMIGRDRGEGPEWTYWDELDQAIDSAMREESK